MVYLVPIIDRDFDWMLGRAAARLPLTLPPGGVDDPNVLAIVRRVNAALLAEHARGAWMIAAGGEVVGLCGYLRPPASGEVEIGFGIAPSRRNVGHATQAVAAMVDAACDDPAVDSVRARTAVTNLASQKVLARNDFVQVGSEVDAEEGQMILWRRPIRRRI